MLQLTMCRFGRFRYLQGHNSAIQKPIFLLMETHVTPLAGIKRDRTVHLGKGIDLLDTLLL